MQYKVSENVCYARSDTGECDNDFLWSILLSQLVIDKDTKNNLNSQSQSPNHYN
jgi:hypothetical protein